MAFIRNTDRLIEGSSKLFFSEIRAKAAVQSDLDLLASDISAEESARISEDNGMKLRLDVIEGGAGVSGSIAKAQADAQAYADQKVAALVNSAPEVLDTLKELSDALGGDANFATTIAGQVGDVDAKVDQEILDREAAVSALDSRLDSLELDSVTKTYVDGEISSLDSRLDVIEGLDSVEGSVAKAEKDAKDYADSLDSAMDARMQVLESDPVTKTYVDGEVSDLQGQVNTEKGRIDAILSASEADKDSFAEIVSLINSVDTANDSAFAGYVLSNDAALAQEVSDREAGDSALDTRLDVLEGSGEGSVAKAEQDAKDYADSLNSAMDSRVDTLESDPVTKTYVDSADNARLKLDGTSAMTGAVNFSSAFTLSQNGSAVLTSVNASSPLQVNRGMRVPVASITGNATVATATGFLHGVQSLSAPRTITLPPAATAGIGRMLVIKDETGAASSTNYIRIQPASGQKIDGENYYDIVVPYESVMIYASGNNWFII